MGVLQATVLEWVLHPPPGNLPNPGIEPRSPALQANSLLSDPPSSAGKDITNAHQYLVLFSFRVTFKTLLLRTLAVWGM